MWRQMERPGEAGLGMVELLVVILLVSACLLPLFHHLVATGPLIKETILKEAAATINTSYLETYRSQPYQRLKLLLGESNLVVSANYRSLLQTKLAIVEIIPDRLLGLTITTSFPDTAIAEQSLATMVANHHPICGAVK